MMQEQFSSVHTFRRGFVPAIELRQCLPSQVEAISPFVDQLMGFVKLFRGANGSEINIEIALREALGNAVVHGNRGNSLKFVFVVCRCSIEGEVSITIRDQGQGFDPDSVTDPTVPENRESTHGRGIHLMRAFMDAVSFEEGGRVVRMYKKANARQLPQKVQVH